MAEFISEKAVERFQTIIRKKTISHRDGSFDREEFESFLPLLRELYPSVFKTVETHLINEFGILLRWKGKDESLKPVILMAHHDVVPADGQDWKHPPFEAEIHDGVMWGRGTTDNKALFTSILEAMEILINKGFTPERDIYFASGNCEEYLGDTMSLIVDWFIEKKIEPWFVLDEGGAIMLDLPMGVTTPFAMVALSERGYGTVRLTAHGKAGAISAKNSAPLKLVKALNKLESTPPESTITPYLEEMLKRFAPHVSPVLKNVFNNLWLFKPIVKKVMETTPDTAAMIRSAITLTKLEAGNERGSVPETATAQLSLRIAPQDKFDDIIDHIRKTVGEDFDVEVTKRGDPPAISDFDTDSFRYIESMIKKSFPGTGVSPFALNAFTDARHFSKICKEVYRFAAFAVDDDRFNAVHNANERMPVADFLKMIDFYTQFIENLH